jgi:hypothetical protein
MPATDHAASAELSSGTELVDLGIQFGNSLGERVHVGCGRNIQPGQGGFVPAGTLP